MHTEVASSRRVRIQARLAAVRAQNVTRRRPSMYKSSLAMKVGAIGALVENRIKDNPLNITLELTRRCNARCDYCNHWKEQKQTEHDLQDFVAIIKRYNPFSVTVCG